MQGDWGIWGKGRFQTGSKYPLISFDKTLSKIIGSAGKLPKTEFNKGTKIPIISQEKELISGYSDKENLKIKAQNLPIIVYGDHTQTKKLIDFEFIIGADGVRLLKPIDSFNIKFYFYYLKTINFETSTGYTRHTKYLKNELIPLPPLAVQEKIVALIDEWKAEIKELKQSIKGLEIDAKEEFESGVFN